MGTSLAWMGTWPRMLPVPGDADADTAGLMQAAWYRWHCDAIDARILLTAHKRDRIPALA